MAGPRRHAGTREAAVHALGTHGIIQDLFPALTEIFSRRHNLQDETMSLPMPLVIAQAAPAAAPGNPLFSFLPLIALFAIFYFLMIRPQMKRQKEHRNMVSALAKGDEIVSNGGIAGRVEDVGESFLTVEIAPNVRIKLQKGAISQVLPKGTLKAS